MGAILKELHNSASKFQFPSMPKDGVDVKGETAYQEYNILGKGKMSYPSGMGIQIIKWSGYFWGAGRKKLKRKRKPLGQVPRNLLKRKRPTGLSEAIRFVEYLVRNIKLNQSGEISTMPIRRLLKRLLRNMAGAIATTDIGYIQEQY